MIVGYGWIILPFATLAASDSHKCLSKLSELTVDYKLR